MPDRLVRGAITGRRSEDLGCNLPHAAPLGHPLSLNHSRRPSPPKMTSVCLVDACGAH